MSFIYSSAPARDKQDTRSPRLKIWELRKFVPFSLHCAQKLHHCCYNDTNAYQDHDALDLTDNDITLLSNFPLSPRIRTLLLARNRVAAIQPTLHKTIPNLTTLVLTGNRFAELADLDALSGFARLTHLVFLENPVCAREVCLSLASWSGEV